MRPVGIGLVALLALQGVWLESALSQHPSSPRLDEEIGKQDRIYRSKDDDTPSGYTISRGLTEYTGALPTGFSSSLANLGPTDRWLDIGAGEGLAILDYYTPEFDQMHSEGRERHGKKARAVAISIEDRRTALWRQRAVSLEADQIQYLINKRLREYSGEELGKFQIITDVVGGFSYTENLSLFMEKVLSFLELNGSFFTLLQDVHAENATNAPHYTGSPYLTEIVNADGSEMRVCTWLKSITCVHVTCEFKPRWRPPIEAFRVHKVCEDTKVPRLATVYYEAGTPPERRFRLGSPMDE